MIDYKKIEKIAIKLEKRLGINDGVEDNESTVTSLPIVPCIEAKSMTASEREDGLKRLAGLAREVKASGELTERQKMAAAEKIRRVAVELFGVKEQAR